MSDRTCCTVPDCERVILAVGLCGKHYQRMRNKGSTGDPVRYTPEQRAQAARDANRRHYQRHGDRVRQAKRDAYSANPEPNRERCRQWHAANADKVAIRARAWREANPERRAQLYREWVAANPLRARQIWADKRARRLALMRETSDGPVDYAAILAEHGMVCHICSDPIASFDDLHFDHVIPLARGGRHVESNIRPAHGPCNLRKSDKLLAS